MNRVNIQGEKQGKIVGGADVYVSDFGNLEVVPHYLMAGADMAFGLNTEYIDMAYLRSFNAKPLAKTGDSEREQVLVDVTLRVRSEVAQMKIDNCTP